jgi:hypothetical protein
LGIYSETIVKSNEPTAMKKYIVIYQAPEDFMAQAATSNPEVMPM